MSGGKITPIEYVKPYTPKNGEYDQGMYKVGFDIPAGSYLITANDSHCYIEINRDSYNTFDSIIDNENISLKETEHIYVYDGQYLLVDGGTFVPVD